MLRSLGRCVLLVRDHEEAREFYCGVLGFEVIHDESADGQRFLHVGVPGQAGVPPVGLWLMMRTSSDEARLVGNQAGSQPLFVLYTDDCRATADSYRERGVEFRVPPKREGGATFARFFDLYGNEIVLVELH